MFDLITGQTRHIPSKPGVPILISMSAQLALVSAIVVPVLFFTGALPEVPTMMAFVAEASAPPPPPPPPPPPAAKSPGPASAKPAPSPGAAPVEPPSTIQPERPNDEGDIGVPGGVEGGIPGGVLGGVVGGLPGDIPPPPPPPAPPPPRAPVRVGGQIQAPALVSKVDPVYPEVAVSARIRGVVILEANVDRDGHVVDVKVLRTASRLLDNAAITAVRQWQYKPLVLNGSPEPFVLTVVLTFNLVEDS
ncbi:MAG TPA: energy transducer TonB [Vicinamibacterales bacterium]|nr:energy transducer TonB [Vicinamibacterales bacterium]